MLLRFHDVRTSSVWLNVYGRETSVGSRSNSLVERGEVGNPRRSPRLRGDPLDLVTWADAALDPAWADFVFPAAEAASHRERASGQAGSLMGAASLDLYFLAYVLTARRVRDTFSDFGVAVGITTADGAFAGC